MPTYKFTAPDGKVYRVTGEGSGEEALAQLQASLQQSQSGTPPQNSNPSDVAEPAEATGDKLARWGKEALGGAIYAGQRASAGITGMLPRSVEEFLVKNGVSPSQEQLDAGKQFVQTTGPASTIGQMGADIGMQLAPSSIIAKAAAPLTALRATMANLAGQGGLNAALTPTSEGRGVAAAAGAGGTAAGSVIGRVVGGPLRTMVSNEGRQLLDAGIPLTPGQAVSGPNAGGLARTLRGTEDKIGSIPFLGDVVRSKARDAANVFSTNEINTALKPIGAKVEGVGHDALDNALARISETYERVLPEIHVPASSLPNLVDDAISEIRQTNPLFNTQQEEALRLYDGRRLQEFAAAGADLSGSTAKKIDQELGEYIRKFRSKNTVYDQDMSAAFTAVRDKLRQAMVGTTDEARQVLRNADEARAKLQPLLTAASPETGEFTAGKLVKTLSKVGAPSQYQRAASHVLPAITPDSGTAGRQMLANLLSAPTLGAGAAVAASGGGMLPALAAAGGAAAMYTKPGMRYLTDGLHPLVEALRNRAGKPKVNREDTEALIQLLTSQPIRAGVNARGE